MVGFNRSIPHKVAMIEHLDGLGASAEVIGAVNCMVRRRAGLIGENTDGRASWRPCARSRTRRAAVVMFGAGGAAVRSRVEAALAGAASVTVVNRDVRRGEHLAELIESRTPAAARALTWDRSYQVPPGVGVLVNATSIRLSDPEARIQLDLDSLAADTVVADVIPNPPRMALIPDAQAWAASSWTGWGCSWSRA